jgi:mandelate racemase
MQLAPLTFKSIRARAVVLKLKRPVVARIATITDWPVKRSSDGALVWRAGV